MIKNTKNGSTAYMIIAYLGVDQVTRKQKWTTSRVSKLKEKSKLKKQSYKLKYKTRAF